MILSANPITW